MQHFEFVNWWFPFLMSRTGYKKIVFYRSISPFYFGFFTKLPFCFWMLQKYLDSKRISAHFSRTALTVTYLNHFDEWGVNLQMQWQTRPEWKVLDIKLHCEFEKQNNNMWLLLRFITFQFMKYYNFLRMTNFNEMICYCICRYQCLINIVHTYRAIFN